MKVSIQFASVEISQYRNYMLRTASSKNVYVSRHFYQHHENLEIQEKRKALLTVPSVRNVFTKITILLLCVSRFQKDYIVFIMNF